MPAVLNAANEIVVDAFLKNKIGFTDIPSIIEKALSLHKSVPHPALKEILESDRWARDEAHLIIGKLQIEYCQLG